MLTYQRRSLPLLALSLFAALPLSSKAQDAAPFPAPRAVGDAAQLGRHVQRTMRLLATSTPERRNTVRVLFYGQSITEQAWWKTVAEDLRTRYPHADLVIENRAIGGHASQLLVKTAEADLYPFQPDLLIFHVYGSHDKYEDILRRVRERTTAEILQQNDHVTKPADLSEETDAAKLAPGKGGWDAFMNYAWLPGLAKKYGTEFCDQRGAWKKYLQDHALEPKALLKDGVHLNKHGEFVMAEIVKAHLRYDAALGASPAEGWVKTYEVGKEVAWSGGKLSLPFEGSRVEVVMNAGAAPAAVRIDGRAPSELTETFGFTRTSAYPQSNWPCILKVGSKAKLDAEEWTLTLKNVSAELKTIGFDLAGSKTGPDGAGTVGARFVSNSGRVVIEPEDWNLDFCVKGHGPKLKDGLAIRWESVFRGADTITPPVSHPVPGKEAAVTVAQGLPNAQHTLELAGGEESPVQAIRVFAPPLR